MSLIHADAVFRGTRVRDNTLPTNPGEYSVMYNPDDPNPVGLMAIKPNGSAPFYLRHADAPLVVEDNDTVTLRKGLSSERSNDDEDDGWSGYLQRGVWMKATG